MKDLHNPKWMYLKGLMFSCVLAMSVTLILMENFTWRLLILLALVIWSAARCYYFAFYVIEKYIDPSYKFSGLISFLKYLTTKNRP